MSDLNVEKEFKIGEIKKIEINLEELKIPKKEEKVNGIRESAIPEKYLYQFLRHKNFCDFYQSKINKSIIILKKALWVYTLFIDFSHENKLNYEYRHLICIFYHQNKTNKF